VPLEVRCHEYQRNEAWLRERRTKIGRVREREYEGGKGGGCKRKGERMSMCNRLIYANCKSGPADAARPHNVANPGASAGAN